MTTPSDNKARVAAAMEMLLQLGATPTTGFLSRVPWEIHFLVPMFIAAARLDHAHGPVALVRYCIVTAREIAALYRDAPLGPDLLVLADLFERYPDEAVAYADKVESDSIRRFGGAR